MKTKTFLLLTERFPELEAVAPNRPSALMWLADKPILAHMIVHLLEYEIEDITVVVPVADRDAIAAWLSDSLASYSINLITVKEAMSAPAALAELGQSLLVGSHDLLLLSNRAIVMHDDWATLLQTAEDGIVLGEAAVWVRGSVSTRLTLSGAETLAEAVQTSGIRVEEKRPFKYFPITTMPQLLQTNQRLLGGGFSSADALERSYTEEFGVIPPVFIHKDAEIYSSMIGPYVSIGAGAVVENTVLRDTIIEAGADVREIVLETTHVGANARLSGKPVSVIAADDTTTEK